MALDPVSAVVSGCLVLGLHMILEGRENRLERQRNCDHHYDYISDTYGYKTAHCSKCGHQKRVE
jgi:hypothetical protein